MHMSVQARQDYGTDTQICRTGPSRPRKIFGLRDIQISWMAKKSIYGRDVSYFAIKFNWTLKVLNKNFNHAVCLLHFYKMATIFSNIKTSRSVHVLTICKSFIFLSLQLQKMFLQAWNYCIFYSNLQKIKKDNLALIIPQSLWFVTECKIANAEKCCK